MALVLNSRSFLDRVKPSGSKFIAANYRKITGMASQTISHPGVSPAQTCLPPHRLYLSKPGSRGRMVVRHGAITATVIYFNTSNGRTRTVVEFNLYVVSKRKVTEK